MLPFQRQPIAAALTLMLLSGAIPTAAEEDAVTRGEYLVHAGGCFSCHTVAGGEKLLGAVDGDFSRWNEPDPPSRRDPRRRCVKSAFKAWASHAVKIGKDGFPPN